jgi:hypothetical protein
MPSRLAGYPEGYAQLVESPVAFTALYLHMINTRSSVGPSNPQPLS